jgi:hypothetical protein
MVAVAVVAAVVAVVAVAAPVIVAAAPAIVAGGAAGLAGGAATAAVSTAALTTVAAVAATTAAVAIAVAATATVLDNTAVWDPSFSGTDTGDSENGNLMPLTIPRVLDPAIIGVLYELTATRVYHFAYLRSGNLIISSIPLNYLEAYAFLLLCGLINTADLGRLEKAVLGTDVPNEILQYWDNLKLWNRTNDIKEFGIYAKEELTAAQLAYAAGGFYRDLAQSEIHNIAGSGYYYHFHDFNNVIHVWYGNPI